MVVLSVVPVSVDGESASGVEAGPVVRMGCCSSVVETAVVDDSIKETGEVAAGLLTEEVDGVTRREGDS